MKIIGKSEWMVVGLCSIAGFLAAASAGGTAGAPGDEGNSWRLGDPVRAKNLTIFPVVSKTVADTRAFMTLDEALETGDVVVAESSSEFFHRSRDSRAVPGDTFRGVARVNQLVLINKSKRPVVLLAGELVSGGKQDRIIAKDRIVPAGAPPLPLDVFCVEHGRWSAGGKFLAGNMMVHPSVREKAAVDQEQSSVWNAVRQGSTAAEARATRPQAAPTPLSMSRLDTIIANSAPTEAYRKIYDSSAMGVSVESFAEKMDAQFRRAIANLKGGAVIGVVVAYNGDVAWSDIFASETLFQRYWPKLLRSYAIEALARPHLKETTTREDAYKFLRPLAGSETTESEPGVFRRTEVNEGHYSQIVLESLAPVRATLHWLKIHRTN